MDRASLGRTGSESGGVMSRLDKVLKRLNPEQVQAATSTSNTILVLAGAGSGKTSVLSTRIAHLQEDLRVGTSNMLALTFTRLAAQEMRARVASLIGEEFARKLTVGTFHSFSVQVLRQHAERFGLDRHFSIYDQEDAESLLEAIVKDLRYERAVKISKIDPWGTQDIQGATTEVVREYHFRLRQNNAIDLQGLLSMTFNLLRNDPDITRQYRDRFGYIFVDEYQDTDQTQEGIVKIIQPVNLFVVGDPAQSIYGWRGAKIENILAFDERHPECEVIRLERNYRSTKPILDVANRTIAQAAIKSPLQLWTDKVGKLPMAQQFTTEFEEAEGIRIAIEQLKAEGTDLSKIAVLCRTNHQVHIVSTTLEHKGIETFVVSRSADPLHSHDARRVIDYMALAINAKDERALRHVINWPFRRISDLEMLKEDPEILISLNLPRLAGLKNLIESIDSLTELWQRASDMFLYLVLQLGLPEMYQAQGLLNRDQILRTTALAIQRWETRQTQAGLPTDPGSFLRWIRTRDIQGRLEDPAAGVRVMTVHAAKGLEWDHVFVIGVNEGVFPGKRGDIEEERRLFYVAVTRAREALQLSYTQTRGTFGGHVQEVTPSRFLQALQEKGEVMDVTSNA